LGEALVSVRVGGCGEAVRGAGPGWARRRRKRAKMKKAKTMKTT
jgi:hypothetical protein